MSEFADDQGCIKLPDREPSRLAAGDNGLECWTFWRLFALVAAASRDGSRSEPELDAALADDLAWGTQDFTAETTPQDRSGHQQSGIRSLDNCAAS